MLYKFYLTGPQDYDHTPGCSYSDLLMGPLFFIIYFTLDKRNLTTQAKIQLAMLLMGNGASAILGGFVHLLFLDAKNSLFFSWMWEFTSLTNLLAGPQMLSLVIQTFTSLNKSKVFKITQYYVLALQIAFLLQQEWAFVFSVLANALYLSLSIAFSFTKRVTNNKALRVAQLIMVTAIVFVMGKIQINETWFNHNVVFHICAVSGIWLQLTALIPEMSKKKEKDKKRK